MDAFLKKSYNGKRLGEVRESEELEVQEFRNEANAFSDCSI